MHHPRVRRTRVLTPRNAVRKGFGGGRGVGMWHACGRDSGSGRSRVPARRIALSVCASTASPSP
eukprot:scaffold1354_cov111-Isochrysis_galbana.AAC.12